MGLLASQVWCNSRSSSTHLGGLQALHTLGVHPHEPDSEYMYKNFATRTQHA
jgi:hypothetical protein